MAMRPTSQQPFYVLVVSGGAGSGVFVYSPTAGAGNLVASVAAAAGDDPFGNAYLAGQVTYVQVGPNDFEALQNNGGQLNFYSATAAAGPWANQYSLQSDSSGDVTFAANGTMELNPAGVAAITGPTVIGDTPSSRATLAQLEVHSMIGLKARAQPAAPAAGYGLLYVNSADGGLYYKGAGGTNTKLASS